MSAKTANLLIIAGLVAIAIVLADYARTKINNKAPFTMMDYLEFGGFGALLIGVASRWSTLKPSL